ncbi:glycophorin-C [Leuresthes tenuis]|uniref:glycophorin-C n=1 Tax=Leuresthes tenuis TaxID=355514 RepID=UPI003B501A93
MDADTTPSPWVQTHTASPFSELVTKIGKKNDLYSDTADFAALIGGVVSVVLLLFICTIAVLLWCLSRQKGSYDTNEADDDDDDDDDVGSDAALQSKAPLKPKEDD